MNYAFNFQCGPNYILPIICGCETQYSRFSKNNQNSLHNLHLHCYEYAKLLFQKQFSVFPIGIYCVFQVTSPLGIDSHPSGAAKYLPLIQFRHRWHRSCPCFPECTARNRCSICMRIFNFQIKFPLNRLFHNRDITGRYNEKFME